MEIHLIDILHFFLLSFLCGVFFGALYDLTRLTRAFFAVSFAPLPQNAGKPLRLRLPKYSEVKINEIKDRKSLKLHAITFFCDLLFSLIVGVSVSVLLYHGNEGEFRLLALAILLFGFLLYFFSIGVLVKKLLFSAVKRVKYLFYCLILLLLYPFRCLYILLAGALQKLFAHIGQRIRTQNRKRYTARAEAELLSSLMQDLH